MWFSFALSDCTGTQSAEFVCETPRRAKCLETKAWEPPFVDCRGECYVLTPSFQNDFIFLTFMPVC